MKISVALCTHNGAAYVAQQVESILAQTLQPSQIVLSDDASTDSTVAIVRELVERHPHIAFTVFENNPALRVTKNFEQAMLASTGDLVALSDQDDVWHPERLATIAALFEQRPEVLLVHSDASLVDGEGAPLGTGLFESLEIADSELEAIDDGRTLDVLLRRNVVTGATTVVRRELVATAAPFPESWVHDEWLAAIAAATGRTAVIRAQLVDYRQHGANQIGARRLSALEKARKLGVPREERNRGLVARASDLVQQLEALDVTAEVLQKARAKLAHERARYALPAFRLARVASTVRALARGDYNRYSRGTLDAVRDLVQPAR
ncbi:glycosyltransferase family 2 protein [Glaciihabitans arcticus]|uniref:Glycosyltransferase family 2 protein n=1 Tax=Glaciihabitans arcticus TaxID=2668039 RepID=A0A4Q9GME3_9MICO|nr:glycosyltransferase family 2 protein [Glaciihabitans arcticus]TBN55942.1 glycosyltransferase family 2 protein [Glaciihabitans arcticus]